ncbi:regulatory protein, arsR family [Natronoarchaeum philippinense]|uniref:Regulatory protein, arsR family n=1 Tax=Natronoarchaeum philippinense TaxID=558529 RepID=A0A285NS61_NATPI|nr:winged helix-turn-helix domain-containing protein [Natronoarchaeum philippinense]SNZ12362.1 regulatory protein, arsR family [Natronoarchaeum philippinense]
MSAEQKPTPTQEEVIEVLREGRATPNHIKENTSIDSKHAVQHHLKELRLAGLVEKVNTGLYELANDK